MSNAASISAALVLALVVALPAVADESVDAGAADAPDSVEATSGEAGGNATPDEGEVRALSGTSLIGNREVPKSLYIVPWKNSEVGLSTDLSRDLLDEGLEPVDPNEFERRIDFHQHHQQP